MWNGRAWLTAALVLSMIGVARADGTREDVARADALFAEGKALLDRGELPAACAKLEESFTLAPRLGTMLNLGSCFERSGRLARALAMYERAATMAREAGRADREKSARELAAAVEPRVAKLLVSFDELVPGLTVEIDDQPLAVDGGLVPIDPGERKLTARAPGKRPWSMRVSATAGGIVRVRVPRLEQAPAPIRLAPPPPAAPAPVPAQSEASVPRTVGIIAGFTFAAVGGTLGTIYGLRARSLRDDASAHCDARGCDETGHGLIDDALGASDVSTIAFVGAGVGLATALVLWLVAHPSQATTTHAWR